jgi:hypothetical protein
MPIVGILIGILINFMVIIITIIGITPIQHTDIIIGIITTIITTTITTILFINQLIIVGNPHNKIIIIL